MKKFSTIAILALMLVGCNNNFDNVAPTIEGTPMTIVASIDDADIDGRTALNSADGKSLVWKTGDKLGVFCEYNSAAVGTGYQNEFTLSYGDGLASGEFSGTIAGLDAVDTNVEGKFLRYHAYYPMTAANASKKKFALVGTLSAVQSYNAAAEYNDMSADDVMIGQYLEGTKDDLTIPLKFQHVFGLMTFEVSNPTGEAIVVNKIEMTTEEGLCLSGAYTLHASKSLAAGTNPAFNSGSATVGVGVSNGTVAAGGKLTARLMFNRWADTNGKALTVKVYTNKGAQTFNKTATDFSGNTSWGMRLALDTNAMEVALVDNYDSATMKEMITGNLTAGGTYCVLVDTGKTSSTSQIRTSEDVTIIGRYTSNGVPQQTLQLTLIPCKSGAYGNNLVVKDIIWKASNSPYVLRMNSPVGNLASVIIENCIIDCENNTGAPFVLASDTYSIESVIIRNCKFINWSGETLVNCDFAGISNCKSFVFENNTINTTIADATVEGFINFGTNDKPATYTIQNNTLIAE